MAERPSSANEHLLPVTAAHPGNTASSHNALLPTRLTGFEVVHVATAT